MQMRRRTMAQALIEFLRAQYVERDGHEQRFFAGCFGIFGHGNVGGLGQALQQTEDFPYILSRNEQAMVHTASGFAKMSNRLRTFACTSSIGPGATNMVTAAAGATINRLPVLLLPGDIFARRNVAPVLQQLESEHTQDISVNDCFRPISRYWDRLYRPEQLITSLPEAMRVLTSPSETGAVTLALPQDVQAEAYEFPAELFEKRIWTIPRPQPDEGRFQRAVDWIRQGRRPLIIAGGGVRYSEANEALTRFVERTGIPVAETQAGKGALSFNHPQSLGAIGVTGTPGANRLAREADLVIGIGTRYTDFTTQSTTLFQNPDVRFVNVNVAEFDAYKRQAIPLVADARRALELLEPALEGYHVDDDYAARIADERRAWDGEVERVFRSDSASPMRQGAIIGAVNEHSGPRDVVVCAAGSLPGDLHKLWRTRDSQGYQLEYGYSCMGYEIAASLGAKMAVPDRDVYVMVGDGSYLMLSQEIVTSLQEGQKLTIVLLNNHGFGSIGGLSEGMGSNRFGTEYRYREDGGLCGERIPVDYTANAASLGAHALRARDHDELTEALTEARHADRTTVIEVATDPYDQVGNYESWWDVPVAEVSTMDSVKQARESYERMLDAERFRL